MGQNLPSLFSLWREVVHLRRRLRLDGFEGGAIVFGRYANGRGGGCLRGERKPICFGCFESNRDGDPLSSTFLVFSVYELRPNTHSTCAPTTLCWCVCAREVEIVVCIDCGVDPVALGGSYNGIYSWSLLQ